MLLRNKSNCLFNCTDKDNAPVTLQPGQTVEVDDIEGRGYLANYGDRVEKIENGPTETELEKHEKRLANLEKAVGLKTPVAPVETEEATNVDAPVEDKEELIAFLRANWVARASRTRGIEKLRNEKKAILEAKEKETLEA